MRHRPRYALALRAAASFARISRETVRRRSLSRCGGVVIFGELFERFVAVLMVFVPAISPDRVPLAPVLILIRRELGDLVLRGGGDRRARSCSGAGEIGAGGSARLFGRGGQVQRL